MKLYAGIDLHGKNLVLALVDENDRVAFKRRLPLFLGQILAALEPYREKIAGIAVESTYNWYWLVDGLADAGYEVKLVNTAAVPQYEGLKHRGDDEDARWLARLQHLGLLPTGWICPRETRSVRDLLRKRGQLVRQRTANILSIQSQYARCGGWRIGGETAKRLRPEKIFEDFPDELQALAVFANSAVCRRLEDQIRMLEKALSPKLEGDDDYRILTTMPGVGKILGMTIALETGDVGRFKRVPPSPLLRSGFGGRRAATTDRGRLRLLLPLRPQRPGQRRKEEGGGKPAFAPPSPRLRRARQGYGEGRKNGNKYLSWAYQEAACHCRKNHAAARRWHDRKASKVHPMVAWKALAHKLCRAAYFMMRDQVEFSSAMLFG